jgi:hypothetical protein
VCSSDLEDALYAAFMSWRSDYEHQMSDEYIDECLEINEHEFTEDGAPA